jgi:uncharacterized phage protein gp47/JayE
MPFSRPTLTELREGVLADFSGSLPDADALLRYSNVNVLGQVMAGAVHGSYGYLDYIARQAVPFTATDEYLEAWAGLKGVARKPAVAAGGAVNFTGAPGALILADTELVRSDGEVYRLTGAVTLSGGGAGTGQVIAVVAGQGGEAPAGATLVLSSPIAGVSSTVVAPAGLAGSAAVESNDALRTRMLQAYSAPARGGAEGDYIRWALEVPGVTRAWVQRNALGPGTVVVRFMMDESRVAYDGFPQGADGVAAAEVRAAAAEGDQLAVADYMFSLQPVTALVWAVAPLQNVVDFTLAGLGGASVSTRDLVEAAIATVLFEQGEPGGLVELSYIEAAIATIPAAAGFVITDVVVSNGSVTPSGDGNITSDTGYLPVLGAVTYS